MYEEIAARPDFEAMHEPESQHPLLPLRRRRRSETTRRSIELNRELRERYNRRAKAGSRRRISTAAACCA